MLRIIKQIKIQRFQNDLMVIDDDASYHRHIYVLCPMKIQMKQTRCLIQTDDQRVARRKLSHVTDQGKTVLKNSFLTRRRSDARCYLKEPSTAFHWAATFEVANKDKEVCVSLCEWKVCLDLKNERRCTFMKISPERSRVCRPAARRKRDFLMCTSNVAA